mmetsp:Transcript_8523/g.29270  ORF Transcript_8523/g.29270 Transcript_8523/m.29270 type:complete len:254 (+) Transcript_8523:196-957(+)
MVSPSLVLHSPSTMVATSATKFRSLGTLLITFVDVSTVAATASCTGCLMFLFSDPVSDCRPCDRISTSREAFSTESKVTGISRSSCKESFSTSREADSVARIASVVSRQAWSKVRIACLKDHVAATKAKVATTRRRVFSSESPEAGALTSLGAGSRTVSRTVATFPAPEDSRIPPALEEALTPTLRPGPRPRPRPRCLATWHAARLVGPLRARGSPQSCRRVLPRVSEYPRTTDTMLRQLLSSPLLCPLRLFP